MKQNWIATIIEIVCIGVIIKFGIFPICGYFLGVQTPLVVVMSESMEHNNGLYCPETNWSNTTNIPKCVYYPFYDGLNVGDIIILHKTNFSIGNVIVFMPSNKPIIHRVVSISPLETKGDNNLGQLPEETNIQPNQYIGTAWFRIPYLGYPKIIVYKLLGI